MLRLAVLGAGPTGLEAALAGVERGWDVTVYEAAPTVAGSVRAWGHVRLFTPWDMNVSPRAAAAVGIPTPDVCPTGADYAEHLDRVAALLPDVRLSTTVESVARDGLLKNEEIGSDLRAARDFRLLVNGPDGERVERADVVLDCTGTWTNPNPTGHGGIPALGEIRFDRGEPGDPICDALVGHWTGVGFVLLATFVMGTQDVASDPAITVDRHSDSHTFLHWMISPRLSAAVVARHRRPLDPGRGGTWFKSLP